MENKPLKRNANIVKLSKDHHAGLLFCWKIRQGVKYHIETDRMIKYVKYFWEHHFAKHFKEEEDFLFAPVQDNEVQKALEDHQKIKIFVDKIAISGMEREEGVLLELADTVDDHIRYEERVLFPHLQEKLSDEQLEKIGEQIPDASLADTYEDHFWEKSRSL
ncbi:MAG: hemerythrin domain-containing protein [Bacteroidota bacterium]|nr:hemerythrin domain-containing protein [Bacteroidota bacterium]